MRRILLVIVPVLAAVLAVAGTARADSPHFLFANASVSSTTGALSVDFKDAGLGTGVSSIAVTLTVDSATALYQCFNGGGNHPQAGNKETVQTSLVATGTFPVRHGQVTASISVGPPTPGGFACPNGQRLFLQTVTYNGITVSDETGNSSAAAPDPVSGTGHILIG